MRSYVAPFALAVSATHLHASACSHIIDDASNLILITASSMNTHRAEMQTFTRKSLDKEWTLVSRREPAVIGKSGLAWGYSFKQFKREGELEKVEGDRRTPAGIFRIGASFGFQEKDLPNHIVIKAGETVCVEDPASPFYNSIRKRAEIGSIKADDMGSTALFRHGLFVNYPSDRKSRSGSCIFIHIWNGPTKGTLGCIALPENRVKVVQEFSRSTTALAILPKSSLDQFKDCLPKEAISPSQTTQ